MIVNLLFIIASLFIPAKTGLVISEVWEVNTSSNLIISGKTNINSFECALESNVWINYLICFQPEESSLQYSPVQCELEIPVNAFDCGLHFITSDMRKTLKSKQHPIINLKLVEISDLISNARDGQIINIKTEIALTGIKKMESINFKVKKLDNHNISLHGSKALRLSDFSLSPKSRLMGAIQVDDELFIHLKMDLTKM